MAGKKKVYPQDEIDRIIQVYLDGKSLREMEKIFPQSRQKLAQILKENNIHIRMTNETSKKYSFDENFFDVIDTEEKAYWLGFMYADGYVTHNQYGKLFGVSINSKDHNHLEKFKKSLGSTHPVNIYYGTGFTGIDGSSMSRLLISSKKAVEDLEKQGCVEKKSKILVFPNEQQVPNSLIYHFIRGYFDGDGTIWKGSQNTYYTFGFIGTKNMMENIKDRLELFDINLSKSHPEKITGIYTLTASSHKYIESLNKMYDNATVYLDRKYDLYKKAIMKIQ